VLRITAPEQVSWDVSHELPVKCEGDSLRPGACLVVVRLETGAVLAAPADFHGPTKSLEVREHVQIPWRDGTLLVTIIRRNQASNRVRIRLAKSEFSFRDPEVERFVARNRRHARHLTTWPGSGRTAQYKRLPESPEIPAQNGIAVKLDGTVVRGSFRLPVLDIDIVREAQGSKFGSYLRTTAVLPITLLITGVEPLDPIQLDLHVPSYSQIDPADRNRTVNGFFSVDLREMETPVVFPQDCFIYAVSGEFLAGPFTMRG
jgi:hypothetical protein